MSSPEQDSIRAVIERLTAAWTGGRLDELAAVCDPGIVLVALTPDGEQRASGRDAVIQSYRVFLDQAVLHRFDTDPPHIHVFGTTAVASHAYSIDYAIDGRRWTGTGRERLVLHDGAAGWMVVWRGLLVGEEREVDVGLDDHTEGEGADR